MAVRLSALCAGHYLPPGRFLVLISVKRLCRPQGPSTAGRIRSIEKSNDLSGNKTRDLPACSIVPQPTTPALLYRSIFCLFYCNLSRVCLYYDVFQYVLLSISQRLCLLPQISIFHYVLHLPQAVRLFPYSRFVAVCPFAASFWAPFQCLVP
jgi:hypothetical protein